MSQEKNSAWLIAPSNKISRSHLEKAKKRLTDIGYTPLFRKDILRTDLYFAGTLKRRRDELTEALTSEDSEFVFAVKGGYASMELLRKLDWKKILASQKTIMGYSDITAILIALHEKGYKGRLIHGPNIGTRAWPTTGRYYEMLDACLHKRKYVFKLPKTLKSFHKKSFRGPIIGGNLRIINHLLGTDYDLKTKGFVLALEDVRERPAAIYTMLIQLHFLKKFRGLKGVMFGQMNYCGNYLPLLKKFIRRLGIPVLYDLHLGHGRNMVPFAYGDEVVFDEKKNTLVFIPKD